MDLYHDFFNRRRREEIGFQRVLLELRNNHFDVIANKAIAKHMDEIKLIEKSDSRLSEENFLTIYFIEEELKAIAEMKIVYLYKHFEFILKFLLSASYDDINKKYLYNWEFMTEFLRQKKIETSQISNFKEINELRVVNNAIKHSNIKRSNPLPIEFIDIENILYSDVLNFYNRIVIAPEDFITSLYELIKKDLYEFDDVKLTTMVDKIEKTMAPDIAIKFANKILLKYPTK